MKEMLLCKKLIVKSIPIILLIQITSLIILLFYNFSILNYLYLTLINLGVLFISLYLNIKTLFIKVDGTNKIFSMKRFLDSIIKSLLIISVGFLLISYFTKIKLWAFSLTQLAILLLIYIFTKIYKLGDYNYYNKEDKLTTNYKGLIFIAYFLIAIPLLIDIYNMIFIFYKQYYFAIIIYNISILCIILLWLNKELRTWGKNVTNNNDKRGKK